MFAVGTDIVHIPGFAEQLGREGTTFERVFSALEQRVAATRPRREEHLAGRWAAKEAFIKAWSQALYGRPPRLAEHEVDWAEVSVQPDAWGRVGLHVTGQVRTAIDASLPGWQANLSISHDGDYAVATVILSC